MPDLDVPNPPSELSYPEALDFRHEQILVVNGISLAEADLLQALETERGILRASAAHVFGAHAVESASRRSKRCSTSPTTSSASRRRTRWRG